MLEQFVSLFLASFEPLHGVDGEASTKRFGEDDDVSGLSMVGHYELFILNHSDSTPSHHWPGVVHSLSTPHLCVCLLRCIAKSLDHEGCAHIFLQFVHISGHP